MAYTFAELINQVEGELQDTTNLIWGLTETTELNRKLEDAIREASEYKPYVRKVSYAIESRTGTATTDTGNALVDTTEDQFLTTDADKVIYNTTNNTWAIVTDAQYAVTDDKLVLSKDIMVDGDEDYEIYNKGCHTKYQINIEDVTDFVGTEEHGVIAVEYPIGTRRNFKIDGDILTIDVDSVPDSKVADPATDTEVLVWFETRQRVSQLTTLTGAIDLTAGYAAGLKAIHVDELQATAGTFAEDTLFTIAGVRGTYRVTADATIVVTESECDLTIYPGLLDAATDGDVVTIIGSTLTRELERIVVELTAAMAARSKAINYIGEVTVGGTNTGRDMESWGERKLGIVMGKLYSIRSNTVPKTKRVHPKD